MTKSSRPEGPPARSQALEEPYTSSFVIFMIHAFAICIVNISLGPFSEKERAGRMAEGKVEDKRFLVSACRARLSDRLPPL